MKANNKPLFVTVRSRTGILYEGNALNLTSHNTVGVFDVLGEHANFISLIQKELLIRKKDHTIEAISVDNGVMRVLNNQVDVYIGIKK